MTTYWIDRLFEQRRLPKEGYRDILNCDLPEAQKYLHAKAQEVAKKHFGNHIYLRGLIEISNYCRNNCYYCGIRASNREVVRYRLDEQEILTCCREGYSLGLRTFVLQGGEDPALHDSTIERVVESIRTEFPSCAITLSLGERAKESYMRLKEAGANRYLLRHETYNAQHYSQLHPPSMSRDNRLRCLQELKDIGFQVGSGIMVGSPHQSIDTILEDIQFIEHFSPHMIGIGPFISHHQTPFAKEPNGNVPLTLKLLSIFRLMHPEALIPSTTALASLDKDGHQKGILAGANVIMPNLSPATQRSKYAIYDNKVAFGNESAQGIKELQTKVSEIGYSISFARGDSPLIKPNNN
ncbi:MAG: [FeFe] hydrogenase H-cluster radical SAM maturase HydE [Rikenellaceae bacterium]